MATYFTFNKMTNLLVRLFLCVTILSLNVHSAFLDDAFAAVAPVLEPIQRSVNAILPSPIRKSIKEVAPFDERGLKLPNIFDAINSLNPFKGKSSSKSSNEARVPSKFEKKYRERVAVIKKFGDTLHGGFNETAKFLLLFVGENSRSILSIDNMSQLQKVVERVVDIISVAITVLKNLLEDANSLFTTFTSNHNAVLKFALSQVLKAIPVLPEAAKDMIMDTVNKFI